MLLSSTLARYTDEYSGSDTGLIAKWNFGARGENDTAGEFYNKGFTFDLFSALSVQPMDFAQKNFTFTGGGSDVAIDYDVEMNVSDLLNLTSGTIAGSSNVAIYAPFIFKITVSISDGATSPTPVVFTPTSHDNGWFRPQDITRDAEGYFSILDKTAGNPYFRVASADQVTVTVYWQWNTSYFITDTETHIVTPNASTVITANFLPYYQAAYDANVILESQLAVATQAVEDYLTVHGSPADDGTWTHEGCTQDHYAEYNALVAQVDSALSAGRTSLLVAYDNYDTLAVGALNDSVPRKVVFRIKGNQIQPE